MEIVPLVKRLPLQAQGLWSDPPNPSVVVFTCSQCWGGKDRQTPGATDQPAQHIW